ncbi:IscS subfamily cysteine desulfurase [soil metagenome]
MSNKPIIYLDNNATTPIDKRVLDAMMPFLTNEYANANSTHLFGVSANEAVKKARKQVANLIGAESNEIVFTSGSTEAINIAVKGISESYSSKGKHIITVSTEHSAVLDTCKFLETKGFEVTYLPVLSNGLIDIEVFKNNLRKDTILVSVMYANNETGVIQPIKIISELSHSVGSLFMTDATQAIGKIPVNVDELGIDLLCMSGHKLYAPKGVGALYVRQRNTRVILPTFIHGGGHEKGVRSGTLNVASIVAFSHACFLAQKEMNKNFHFILSLRNYLENELLKIEGTRVNGDKEARLFNTTNIIFVNADSDAIIMGLSNPDTNDPLIAVSNGSACTSTSIKPSHVLTAMGLSELEAFSSIRFSIGKCNSKKEIELVIEFVTKIVSELRQMIV